MVLYETKRKFTDLPLKTKTIENNDDSSEIVSKDRNFNNFEEHDSIDVLFA